MFFHLSILNVLPILVKSFAKNMSLQPCSDLSSHAHTLNCHGTKQAWPFMTTLAEHAGQGAEAA